MHMGSCDMLDGGRSEERQQLTPPSEGTGSLPLSICRTEPRPSITGRVSGRTRACVTYASSPHHLTRHATTYRELPRKTPPFSVKVAVVTAPQPQTILTNTQVSAKTGFFSGFLGDCAVEKFLKNTEGSCKLNELVSVVDLNSFHRNIEEVRDLNEP